MGHTYGRSYISVGSDSERVSERLLVAILETKFKSVVNLLKDSGKEAGV